MSAKDIYHDTVKNALIKNGWKITHDPLVLKWGPKDLFIDMGAERLSAAVETLNPETEEVVKWIP